MNRAVLMLLGGPLVVLVAASAVRVSAEDRRLPIVTSMLVDAFGGREPYRLLADRDTQVIPGDQVDTVRRAGRDTVCAGRVVAA